MHVPHAEPPLDRPWSGEEELDLSEPELRPLFDVLGRTHPPGSKWRWGFNWARDDPRHARAFAEEGIDLDVVSR